ncbi:MAG: AMP-binding protein, partial [Planctomycetes bacterium]|nr:AMP-binding protein [Planctomycetota bacterium]
MQLQNLFSPALRGSPGGVAIEFRGSTLTFGDLEQRSNRWANYLRTSGFQAGDRLAVYLPNCLELIDVYLACTKTGVIFTPINVLYREREIRHILSDAQPRQVLTRADLRRQLPGETRPWVVEDL